MNILMFTKRHYMGKDLVDDAYGRFYELPVALGRRGFNVTVLVSSYNTRSELVDNPIPGVFFESYNLFRSWRYFQRLRALCSNRDIDLVWGCSDALQLLLAAWAARRLGCPLVIDFYDNFESYWATRLLGGAWALAWVARKAAAISCVSRPLANYVKRVYLPAGRIEVLENGVPNQSPVNLTVSEARRSFGLSANKKLVGIAGAISHTRGITTVFEAMKLLPNEVQLVLAGPLGRGVRLPEHDRVRYLGSLEYSRIPVLLRALDVAIIPNVESSFGRYCFPQKYYESVASGVPLVAARVGALAEELESQPACLYEPGSAKSLAAALRLQLQDAVQVPVQAKKWTQLSEKLANLFLEI